MCNLTKAMQDAAKKVKYKETRDCQATLNLDLRGYGDYEARVDNVHKFKDTDLAKALTRSSLPWQWH